MNEWTIVIFNAVAAGIGAYQVIWGGIKDIYKGNNNG